MGLNLNFICCFWLVVFTLLTVHLYWSRGKYFQMVTTRDEYINQQINKSNLFLQYPTEHCTLLTVAVRSRLDQAESWPNCACSDSLYYLKSLKRLFFIGKWLIIPSETHQILRNTYFSIYGFPKRQGSDFPNASKFQPLETFGFWGRRKLEWAKWLGLEKVNLGAAQWAKLTTQLWFNI